MLQKILLLPFISLTFSNFDSSSLFDIGVLPTFGDNEIVLNTNANSFYQYDDYYYVNMDMPSYQYWMKNNSVDCFIEVRDIVLNLNLIKDLEGRFMMNRFTLNYSIELTYFYQSGNYWVEFVKSGSTGHEITSPSSSTEPLYLDNYDTFGFGGFINNTPPHYINEVLGSAGSYYIYIKPYVYFANNDVGGYQLGFEDIQLRGAISNAEYQQLYSLSSQLGYLNWFNQGSTSPLEYGTSVRVFDLVNSIVYATSYEDGYNKGFEDGVFDVTEHPHDYELVSEYQLEIDTFDAYNLGYENGYNESQGQDVNFRSLLSSIFRAPTDIIGNGLNFEIFGINISSLVFFVLTIGLILFIIKKLKV